MSLAFDASGGYLGISDLCAIDVSSIGTNEGTFTPRNFLNVSSWTGGTDPNVSESTKFRFYGYYPTSNSAATYDAARGGVLLSVPSAQTGEFGRHQICSSAMVEMSKAEIVKNKMVRFAFKPATALLRLRLSLSAETDASIREAYVKQVILTVSDCQANLAGSCFLTFSSGVLATTQTDITNKQITVTLSSPVKLTRDKESNGYIDFVLLPTAAGKLGNLDFDVRMPDNTRLTVDPKGAPTDGFQAGVRYFLDREVTIVLSPDSDDASYVNGGDAWESKVDNDGAYTDAGYAW